MTAGAAVLEVTDATFASEVLERSKAVAVVVDFWAPWCGPCRQLGPMIERIARGYAGSVVLAKLNTDENPQTAQTYRIQSIPAVKAYRDGKVVSEFVGALPEPQVKAFFQKLAPAPADLRVQAAREQLAAGDTAAAESAFREALQAAPANADAIVALAAILLDRGDTEEAEQLLGRAPTDRRAKAMRHAIFLRSFADRHANENLEGEAAANPKDARARYRWGVMLAARGQFEEALEELIESVRLDRSFAEGAARKAALAVFDIVGLDHPITRDYQRQLSMLLF